MTTDSQTIEAARGAQNKGSIFPEVTKALLGQASRAGTAKANATASEADPEKPEAPADGYYGVLFIPEVSELGESTGKMTVAIVKSSTPGGDWVPVADEVDGVASEMRVDPKDFPDDLIDFLARAKSHRPSEADAE